MAKFFIHRPVFAIVIAIIISLIGIIAGLSTPIAQYPNISPPTINVSTFYSGANASVVNQAVAQVIENRVNGTQGMDYMSSDSNDDGSYSLNVYFEVGSDGDMDSVKVQNNVASANSSLPETVLAAGVTTTKSSQDMAMIFAFYCDNGLYDTAFIKAYSDIYIADDLKRVKGVGRVQTLSADYALRIWINPEKLANFGLTVADVQNAIKTQNAQAAAGSIGKLPVAQGQEKEYTGQIQGRLETPEQFENIILKTGDAGAFVYLKDVARVEIGQESNTYVGKFNGYTSVPFIINLTSDANALETIGEVKKILREAEKNLPEGIKYGQVLDSTEFITASIEEVAHTFFEALVLVVLVIFIFLQSFRATIIPLLAVPVSLLGTFAAFTVLDFTINTLTLFAMVLAIGLVVDDAIVVIENVEQHMERGLNPVEATEVAMAEVQGPVVAIAFVLSAVFIPIAFLGGMTGILYRQFALTIAVSMGLSAFVALTLTPALCAIILKPHEHGKKNFFSKFFDAFNNWFDRTKNSYVGIVAKVISKTKLAVVFMLIVCGLTGLLFKVLPSTFVPDEDQGYFVGAVLLPEGTSLNRTSMTTDKVAAAIRENVPGIKDVITVAGYNIASGGTKSSAATLFLSMHPWAERTEFEKSAAYAIYNVFMVGNSVAPEAFVIGFNPPALPGLGQVGGLSMQLIDQESHSDTELSDITDKIVLAANARPELQGISTTFSVTSPSYKYELDQKKIEMLGVNLADVYSALQVNFGGMQVDDYNRFGRTYKVVMQSDVYFRGEIDMLKFMFVRGANGQFVPLDTLISYRLNTGTTQVTRFNGKRSVLIQGQPAEGYSSGQAMAALESVVHEVAPTGFGVEWSGQSREEQKAAGSTGQVMALALVFVFLCLAALYESWSVPFSVLMTVPTGIFGALLSEFVLNIYTNTLGVGNPGFQNSIYMQIGVIMIMGLAAKNAILIVEFAKVRTDKGMEAVKASLESAGLRLRPILMTSFAFIIGCLPLATATGAGSAARNSMGVAVVGGMTVATFLGIFLIPVFFVVVQKVVQKIFAKNKAALTATLMLGILGMTSTSFAAANPISESSRVEPDKLAAESREELNDLGVRVAELEKHSDFLKWRGKFRYTAQHATTAVENTAYKDEVASERGVFQLDSSAKVNAHWTANARLEAKSDLKNDKTFDTKLKRVWADGTYDKFNIRLGKMRLLTNEDGLVWDTDFSGVLLRFGSKWRITGMAGRIAAENLSNNVLIESNRKGDPAEFIGANIQYTSRSGLFGGLGWYQVKGNDFQTTRYLNNIGSINLGYVLSNRFKVTGSYAQNTKADTEKHSWQVKATLGNYGERPKQGAWNITAGYFQYGTGVSFAPTTEGVLEGGRGWNIGTAYAPFKNVGVEVKYFKGKDIDSGVHIKNVWGRVEFFF